MWEEKDVQEVFTKMLEMLEINDVSRLYFNLRNMKEKYLFIIRRCEKCAQCERMPCEKVESNARNMGNLNVLNAAQKVNFAINVTILVR